MDQEYKTNKSLIQSPYKNAKPNNVAPTFFDFSKPGTKTTEQKSFNLNSNKTKPYLF